MTGRALHFIAGGFLMATCLVSWGQDVQKGTEPDKAKAKKAAFMPAVYLGNSNFSGGTIKYTEFERLMKEGIYSRDSAGNTYNIIGFDFIYGELGSFEDSLGNPVMLTDYQRSRCKGNKLSSDIVDAGIFTRVKRGDTVAIQEVMLTSNKNNAKRDTFLGKSITCFITR